MTAGGKSPFREWLDSLNVSVRARIQARVLRFQMGNLGDHKNLGSGVLEARLMFGSGYRIYFGKDGNTIIVLLMGGDKGSQSNDVSRAKEFWRDYLEAKQHGKAK